MTSDGRTIDDVRILLVVGPMRTGTTLVARLLDSHPNAIYLGFELAEQWADWTGLPWGAPGADDIACPPFDTDDATPARVAAAREGLSRLLTTRTGATGAPQEQDSGTGKPPGTVVLKNPHFWHRLPFVCTVLPSARIVRTRRPLLPTVASLRRLWGRALEQHGRVHHLPERPDHCWDFVPWRIKGRFDPRRTFPGGNPRVLAEFHDRVNRRLDQFATSEPGRMITEVDHEVLVRRFNETTALLLEDVGLPSATLHPPEPLDPQRLDEWRSLLSPAEQTDLAGRP